MKLKEELIAALQDEQKERTIANLEFDGAVMLDFKQEVLHRLEAGDTLEEAIASAKETCTDYNAGLFLSAAAGLYKLQRDLKDLNK